jgi:flagellar basal-body rod protein FlgC
MDLFNIFRLSGAGMAAQRNRMNVVSGNLANAETTRTPDGGPYRRKSILFRAQPAASEFSTVLAASTQMARPGIRPAWFNIEPANQTEPILTVKVDAVKESQRDPKKVYDPHHPDADPEGYVSYPDINPMEEMADLLSAVRSYEANLATFNATKSLVRRLLELGRNA